MAYLGKILCLAFSITLCNSLQINLGGKWAVKAPDFSFDATVPGGIFSDLMDAGAIEDVFYANGDVDYRWVGLNNWTYSTTFELDDEILDNANINLVFEGIDTFATISVNGQNVGNTRNMFLRYVLDVKDLVQTGTNTLEVQFESTVTVADELTYLQNQDYVVPPACTYDDINCNVNEIRKMQSSYGWDWGPSFASVGIWKDVYLEAFDTDVIRYIVAVPVLNDVGWTLLISSYFDPGQNQRALGSLEISLQTEDDSPFITTAEVDQSPNEYYETLLTTSLALPRGAVKEWWPNGYGDQNLYQLTVKYTSGDEVQTKTLKVGFRTVELVQEEIGNGLSFYFKVNGLPIFAKGSNEIPLNILPEKGQDPDLIRKTLQVAKDTNMNMLRVWGGGIYESDDFYQVADELGIMIWQDFMFACAMYPTRPAFLENVRQEVNHQIKRLASHPSIVLWSGNNENEGALIDSWYGTAGNLDLYISDYVKLYVDTIKTEVNRILKSAVYVTSSPSNGLKSEEDGYVGRNPRPSDSAYEDVHFYDYFSDSWAAKIYPVPRFASEYGFQSMPAIESWLTATDDVQNLNPNSEYMQHRQHHPNGNTQNQDAIKKQLGLIDPSIENFIPAFVYYTQIVQAQAIKVETEHYRSYKGRLNDQGLGNTMGALYWQLNDVWVAPTWSGMDFTGKWKILQYFSKQFFAPSIVTANLRSDNQVEVIAVTDVVDPAVLGDNGNIMIMTHVYRWDSFDVLSTTHSPITLNYTTAVEVYTIDPEAFLTDIGVCGTAPLKNCFFHLHVVDEDMNPLGPTNYYFPEKLGDSNLADANVEISSINPSDEEGKIYEITVTTDAIALFVWLDAHEINGRFSDNGFLLPFNRITVIFTAEDAITENQLRDVLTVTHLRDPAYRISN